MNTGMVVAVSADSGHNFSKPVVASITLIAGFGVEGDAHAGEKIQHLYDKKRNPDAPNLRQIHLMHAELFDDLAQKGYPVRPGQMGENMTTRGIDILGLPRGTLLHVGDSAVIEVTGLRNPCRKLNAIHDGLLGQLLVPKPGWKKPYPLSGIMGIIKTGGVVRADDQIRIERPKTPYMELTPV